MVGIGRRATVEFILQDNGALFRDIEIIDVAFQPVDDFAHIPDIVGGGPVWRGAEQVSKRFVLRSLEALERQAVAADSRDALKGCFVLLVLG